MMIKTIEFFQAFLLLNILIIFIKNLSNSEFKSKKIMVTLFIIYALIYSLFLNQNANLRTLSSIIFIIFISKLFLRLETKDLIYYSIITLAFGIVVDIIVMNIINILSIIPNFNINSKYYSIIGSIIMIIIFYGFSKSFKFKKFVNTLRSKLSKMNHYYLKLFLIIISYFVLGSCCLQNMSDKITIVIILAISITLILVIFFLTSLQFQINSLKENVILLTKNNEFYISIIDEYRIMKHNLVANLMTINSVANKKTRTILEDIISNYSSTNKSPKNIKDLPSGVNGIIYEKIYNIENNTLNISINNKIKNNVIEVLTPRDYNLFCEAICVTLDNAIEAATDSKEKILYLEFYDDDSFLNLKIINTFSGTLDIDKLGTKNYTSKKKGNGLGLYSILTSKNVNTTTMIKNNKFICNLKVKKSKK